jgi:hypothetical protein
MTNWSRKTDRGLSLFAESAEQKGTVPFFGSSVKAAFGLRLVALGLILASASVTHAQTVDVNASVESPRGTWFDFRNYSSGGFDLPPFQLDSPTPNAASYAENSDDGFREATLFASSFGDFNLLTVSASVALNASFPGAHTSAASASFSDAITFDGGVGSGTYRLVLSLSRSGTPGTDVSFTGTGFALPNPTAGLNTYISDEFAFDYGIPQFISGALSTTVTRVSPGFDSLSWNAGGSASYLVWITDAGSVAPEAVTITGTSGRTYGQYTPVVPEPSALALVAVSIMGLLRRRKANSRHFGPRNTSPGLPHGNSRQL